jgi:hypothetical protein
MAHFGCLFETGCYLRGTDVFSWTWWPRPAHKLLDKITEVLFGLMDVYMDAIGIWWTSSRERTQRISGAFLFLNTYREMFKTITRRSSATSHAPNAKLMHHRCGSARRSSQTSSKLAWILCSRCNRWP